MSYTLDQLNEKLENLQEKVKRLENLIYIPADKYRVQLKKASLHKSKNTNKPYIRIVYLILEGEFKDFIINEFISLKYSFISHWFSQVGFVFKESNIINLVKTISKENKKFNIELKYHKQFSLVNIINQI